MNFFKTLAIVGLVGVGMVYGESADTNKIVEIKTQILSFPKDTKIKDKDLSFLLNDSSPHFQQAPCALCGALTSEQTKKLLESLEKLPNIDKATIPTIKVHSGLSATVSNVVECNIPDTDEKKIGATVTAIPIVGKDNYTVELNLNINWIRYFGYSYKDKDGKWIFHVKRPNAIADIPSIKNTKPLIRHTDIESQITLYDGQTLVFNYQTLDDLTHHKVDQTTLLLVTVNLKDDESKIRTQLSDKLNKAIVSKDKAAFEECMDFDKSNPSTVKNIHKLEDQIFGWVKPYIDIVDPVFFDQLKPQISASGNTVLTYDIGTTELKGKYLFDVHICKDLPSKHGYSFNCAGGTIDGIPKILSNILDNVSTNNPSPIPQ